MFLMYATGKATSSHVVIFHKHTFLLQTLSTLGQLSFNNFAKENENAHIFKNYILHTHHIKSTELNRLKNVLFEDH